MQRKRNKTYFSENIELGSNIIPSPRGLMRKFKMKSLLKYAIMMILGFVLYSVYEKLSFVSKDSLKRAAADMWSNNDGFVKQMDTKYEHNNRDTDGVDDGVNDDHFNRRVKEEINKVFEEFKQQQEGNEREKPNNIRVQDPVQMNDDAARYAERLEGNEDQFKNKDLFRNDRNWNDDNADNKYFNDNGNAVNIDGDFNAGVGGGNDNNVDGNFNNGFDGNNDLEEGNVNNNMEDKGEDVGDHYEKVLSEVMDIINDKEEEEELEIEEEIELRLAEVLKDAVNEVADEKAEGGFEDNAMDGGIVREMNGGPATVAQVFEKKEFNVAVNQMGQKLNPLEMQQLNEKRIRGEHKNDEDHEFPPFVTAAGVFTYKQVTQLVASIQSNLPGRKIYIYDLDLAPEQKKHLMTYCGVRMRRFIKGLFPEYVKDFQSYHWKPLVIQTALAEFGHITWVNPQYRLSTQQLGSLLHDSHETGVLIVGQFASYSTYSATNPKMYDFIPSNKDKLANIPHVEIRAIIIHNTPEVHQNVMKLFTACALEENCLAPPGSRWTCKFDFTGKKLAGCHRYDESAMNILLKNWFNFEMDRFARRNSFFRDYDPGYKPNLKLCRSVRDIRDAEL